MESTIYPWYKESIEITSIKDRISFLEELILNKTDEYEELCDRNMEIVSECFSLCRDLSSDRREYFILKRKEADVQRSLMEHRKEQELLLEFYNSQFKEYELAQEFVKPMERATELKFPGRKLSVIGKFYLLELLYENKLLYPLSKKNHLISALPLIMGIPKSTIEGNLKDYGKWKEKKKDNKNAIHAKVGCLKEIKDSLNEMGFKEKDILDPLAKEISDLESKL